MSIPRLMADKNYIILGFSQHIPPLYRQQLLAMGLLPGSEFKIKRFAPLGSTMELEVNNFNLTVRLQEFLAVLVQEKVYESSPA